MHIHPPTHLIVYSSNSAACRAWLTHTFSCLSFPLYTWYVVVCLSKSIMQPPLLFLLYSFCFRLILLIWGVYFWSIKKRERVC